MKGSLLIVKVSALFSCMDSVGVSSVSLLAGAQLRGAKGVVWCSQVPLGPQSCKAMEP
jgi:hypothetical protein